MLFLDATVLVGAADPRDARHGDAQATFAAIGTGRYGTALTSDLVLDETVTILGRRRGAGPKAAAAFARKVLSSPRVKCLYLDEGSLGETLALYPRYEAALSFTDVSTVALMLRQGCDVLFSHDADFDRVRGILRKERP